jgi:hypothetical protein
MALTTVDLDLDGAFAPMERVRTTATPDLVTGAVTYSVRPPGIPARVPHRSSSGPT